MNRISSIVAKCALPIVQLPSTCEILFSDSKGGVRVHQVSGVMEACRYGLRQVEYRRCSAVNLGILTAVSL